MDSFYRNMNNTKYINNILKVIKGVITFSYSIVFNISLKVDFDVWKECLYKALDPSLAIGVLLGVPKNNYLLGSHPINPRIVILTRWTLFFFFNYHLVFTRYIIYGNKNSLGSYPVHPIFVIIWFSPGTSYTVISILWVLIRCTLFFLLSFGFHPVHRIR